MAKQRSKYEQYYLWLCERLDIQSIISCQKTGIINVCASLRSI